MTAIEGSDPGPTPDTDLDFKGIDLSSDVGSEVLTLERNFRAAQRHFTTTLSNYLSDPESGKMQRRLPALIYNRMKRDLNVKEPS